MCVKPLEEHVHIHSHNTHLKTTKNDSASILAKLTTSSLIPSQRFSCIPDLTIVAKLVSVLFTLVWADDELEIVPVQKVLCDIRTPITASATDLVGNTTILRHGVTPQQVQNLMAHKRCQTSDISNKWLQIRGLLYVKLFALLLLMFHIRCKFITQVTNRANTVFITNRANTVFITYSANICLVNILSEPFYSVILSVHCIIYFDAMSFLKASIHYLKYSKCNLCLFCTLRFELKLMLKDLYCISSVVLNQGAGVH